jgi:phosphohistidine swiveling domain-containing protein
MDVFVPPSARHPSSTIRDPSSDIEWTRANVREVLPDVPSPQVMDFLCVTLNRAERLYAGSLWAPEAELGAILRVFHGRPYFNVSQLRHISRLAGSPPARMFRALGYSGPVDPDDEQTGPRPVRALLRALPALARVAGYQMHVRSLLHRHLAVARSRQHQFAGLRVEAMSDAELWAAAREWTDNAAREILPIFVMTGVMAFEDQLRKILDRLGFEYDDLVHPWLAAGGKSVSAQQGFDLLRLAAEARGDQAAAAYFLDDEDLRGYRTRLAGTRFLASLDRFLGDYGHRGPYESDWALPRFRDDPSPILACVRTHVRAGEVPDADAIVAEQERRAREAWDRFEARLSTWQRLSVRARVRWLVRRIKQMYVWRELYRSELTKVLSEGRRILLESSRRFADRGWIASPGDFFLLTLDEVTSAIERGDGAAVRAIAEARGRDVAGWRLIEMPLRLRESELAAIRAGVPASAPRAVRELRGLCVSRGVAEADVIVLHTPDEFGRMKHGAIIVAPATDPAWTPVFTLASGVIVEIGGTLSHASTVAREYGLPALANVADATRILKDGDRVRLDATGGRVEVLASRAAAAV